MYRRGRAKEYRVKKQWEEGGYTVLRTAGSHGFADLIAIRAPPAGLKGNIFFIQVKSGKTAKKEREKALKEMREFSGLYWVAVDVA